MLFNSFEFAVFFPLVTGGYFLLPHRLRWALLLAASCGFYMAFIPRYIAILAVTIMIDYVAGLLLGRADLPARARKAILVGSILSTCLVLFVFKYWNFVNGNVAALARVIHWNYPIGTLDLILPIGLSFHTFQSLSYVIEVYRGHQQPERHFGIYALYVMFYPQLVAGPIERPQNLLHQFRERHAFYYDRVTDGLRLMLWGMFKKVVIADRLAIVANTVYGQPHDFAGASLIVATVCFAFQIYCDFSGYSDIALGAARVMGFELMPNFRQPYLARSVADFWKRWHISLSTWFRDYVYIPLGGRRAETWRWQFNLLVTFIVSGVWHGANWTYVAWGALNGLYLVSSLWTQPIRERLADRSGLARIPGLYASLQIAGTFSLICVAWVFFRAANLTEAWYVLTEMFHGLLPGSAPSEVHGIMQMGLGRRELAVALLLMLFVMSAEALHRRWNLAEALKRRPLWLRWAGYYGLVLGIIFGGVFGEHQFIYFQF